MVLLKPKGKKIPDYMPKFLVFVVQAGFPIGLKIYL